MECGSKCQGGALRNVDPNFQEEDWGMRIKMFRRKIVESQFKFSGRRLWNVNQNVRGKDCGMRIQKSMRKIVECGFKSSGQRLWIKMSKRKIVGM